MSELQFCTNDYFLAKYNCMFDSRGIFVGKLFPVDNSQWTPKEIFFPEYALSFLSCMN